MLLRLARSLAKRRSRGRHALRRNFWQHPPGTWRTLGADCSPLYRFSVVKAKHGCLPGRPVCLCDIDGRGVFVPRSLPHLQALAFNGVLPMRRTFRSWQCDPVERSRTRWRVRRKHPGPRGSGLLLECFSARMSIFLKSQSAHCACGPSLGLRMMHMPYNRPTTGRPPSSRKKAY